MDNVKTRKPSYFFWVSIVGLVAVLVGFGKTFILPASNGDFPATSVVYVHGAFAFSWILLFIFQTSFIHFKKYSTHIFLGTAGIVIALGTAVTMLPAGMYATNRDLQKGLGDTAISAMLGVVTSALMFLGIFFAGILNRRKAATHKRLMLLATIVVLWPAWFRFRHYFPSVPRPDIWFALVLADSLIVISCIWDKLVNGRVHPVLKFVGLFIILEHTFEVIYFDSPTWRTLSKFIYDLLS
ncbi:MAG TPA: hypothetical protein VLC98_05550 [Phnomibacter sp.]|nr:hypothetical protein [Phnomibacter sp.]